MSIKHTPGPWVIDIDCHPELNPVVRSTLASRGAIAEVFPPRHDCPILISEQERDANARLITAAPDLLTFVESIARLDPYSSDVDPDDAVATLDRLIADAALLLTLGGLVIDVCPACGQEDCTCQYGLL